MFWPMGLSSELQLLRLCYNVNLGAVNESKESNQTLTACRHITGHGHRRVWRGYQWSERHAKCRQIARSVRIPGAGCIAGRKGAGQSRLRPKEASSRGEEARCSCQTRQTLAQATHSTLSRGRSLNSSSPYRRRTNQLLRITSNHP